MGIKRGERWLRVRKPKSSLTTLERRCSEYGESGDGSFSAVNKERPESVFEKPPLFGARRRFKLHVEKKTITGPIPEFHGRLTHEELISFSNSLKTTIPCALEYPIAISDQSF